jgi:predicted histone-like DNA-binding protein
MALRYVIKKRTFGFDKTKAEKYVAQNVITNTVDFRDLCEEITKVGMVPSGAVKFVLDALIDTLNLNLRKGISVQLGNFGCFRPGMNCESQDTEKDVDSDTIRRVKIIFTPGYKFKEMLSKVSVQKAVASDDGSISPEQPDPNPNPNPDDGKGEAPDPAA